MANMWDKEMLAALKKPAGARFLRCALQVNPFAYGQRHAVEGLDAPTEEDYNDRMANALADAGIEVVAITDHYRVKASITLADAVEAKGITVFPGFEAVTKEGIHVLCLFNPGTDWTRLERYIGKCGINDDAEDSPTGDIDFDTLLATAQGDWGGLCIAAHVCGKGGLLTTLKGQACIKAWKNDALYACSLPATAKDAPEAQAPILNNKNANYKRERAVAIVNSQDLSRPEDALDSAKSCAIKMATIGVEGLRQAFLDPESRIQLNPDDVNSTHSTIVAATWQGGFLDGLSMHFNDGLNVVIGGRGTGKSTLIESIRYVMGVKAVGANAAKQHDETIKKVVGRGATISVLIRSRKPTVAEYLVSRRVLSAKPTVTASTGELIDVTPVDLLGPIEVFGQHEISELARDQTHLTTLLSRFRPAEALDGETTLRRLRRELADNRRSICRLTESVEQAEGALSQAQSISEKLRRYREAGIEERLKDRSQLIEEQSLLQELGETLEGWSASLEELQEEVGAPDGARFAETSLKKFGRAALLVKARGLVVKAATDAAAAIAQAVSAVDGAATELEGTTEEWEKERTAAEASLAKTVRKIEGEDVDADEFFDLKKQAAALQPVTDKLKKAKSDLAKASKDRTALLKEWRDAQGDLQRNLAKASRKVTRKMAGIVRVTVAAEGDLKPLEEHLRSMKGRISETMAAIKNADDFSLEEFADALAEGDDSWATKWGAPSSQVARILNSDLDWRLQTQELELPTTTSIELNISPVGVTANWRRIENLSTGQRATAILLLLLQDANAPLIIDQPEDDLDNRFISEEIVQQIKRSKHGRQFVFATHNANIPVLGDAELIAAMTPVPETPGDRAELLLENLGSIDSDDVQTIVSETLEGGRAAFEMRRLKYGF